MVIYILSIITLLVVWLFTNFQFIFTSDISKLKKELVEKKIELKNIITRVTKFRKLGIISISHDIRKLSKDNGVKLISMYKENKLLHAEIQGRYKNIAIFLNLLESKLKHFKLLKVRIGEETASFTISFVHKSELNVSKIGLKDILCPFEKKIEYQEKEKSKIVKPKELVFKLEAIMNKSVKINGKWYRLFENIERYRVVRISGSYVLLKHIVSKQFKKLLF